MELNITFRPFLHNRFFSLLVFGVWLESLVGCLVVLGECRLAVYFFDSKGSLISRKPQYFCVQSGQFRPEIGQLTTVHLERKKFT